MQIPKPSASMIVATTALVFGMTGAGIAAVNATSVDGLSAAKSGTSAKRVAGKLIATERKGTGKGTIASRYLNPGTSYSKVFPVEDNRVLAPTTFASVTGLGSLTAQCFDQNNAAGNEDPATTVAFVNSSGTTVNVSRTIGVTAAANSGIASIGTVPNGTQSTFSIGGSNTFEYHVQKANINYFVRGVVRQDGRGTANASCLIYGFTIAVK